MLAGGCEWEERKVDRPGRLLLRCLVFQDNIVVGSSGVMGMGDMTNNKVVAQNQRCRARFKPSIGKIISAWIFMKTQPS